MAALVNEVPLTSDPNASRRAKTGAGVELSDRDLVLRQKRVDLNPRR